jgi:hypothetical protein
LSFQPHFKRIAIRIGFCLFSPFLINEAELMVSQPIRRLLTSVLAIAFFLSIGAAVAQATIANLEAAQQANPNLRNQWRFEGPSDATRLADSKGTLTLQKAAGEGGMGANDVNMTPMDTADDVPWSHPAGDVNMIGFQPGLNGGASQAYRPQSIPVTSTFAAEQLSQARSGAGLYAADFSTPAMLTLEAVVKPDVFDSVRDFGYIAQTRPGASRGYFLAQMRPDASRGAGGSLSSVLTASSLTAFADRPRILKDYSDQSHWYYVAVTYDFSGGETQPAVVSSWYADLTAGGPLTQSLNAVPFPNATTPQTLGAGLVGNTGLLGVGLFVRPGATVLAQEFFRGSIDNLAVYTDKLTSQQIQGNLDALRVIPEPSTCVLLVLTVIALLPARRRAA